MKKNNLDDYINNLKPLAEQEQKVVTTRNLPMRVKKPKNNSAKYFRYTVGLVLSVFFIIFIVNIVQSNRRALDERYQNTDIVKKPEEKKKVVVGKRAVKSKSAQVVATPPIDIKEPVVVSAPPVRTPPPVEVRKVVAVTGSPVQSKPAVVPQKTIVPPPTVAAVKTAVLVAKTTAMPPTQAAVTKPNSRNSVPEFFTRPYRPMILAINPPKKVIAQAQLEKPAAVATPIQEEKPTTTFENTAEAKQAKKLLATDIKPVQRTTANKPAQQTKIIAAVTKSSNPVIEKPIATPVVETPKKVPVSLQVAKLTPDQRMAKAKQLFDQQQWYDACDIYRKEMYNAGHSKSRRHEAVVRAAQCYYKLGYKNTADHLLSNVIDEGGSWKKEAKAVLEANK